MRAHVKVLLYANFREMVGKREIVEEINLNSTLRQILDKLATNYGRDFQQLIARAA
jgi:molybdopterin converting factor small subunit